MKKNIFPIVVKSVGWGWFQMFSIWAITKMFGTPHEWMYMIFFLSGFAFLTTMYGIWEGEFDDDKSI